MLSGKQGDWAESSQKKVTRPKDHSVWIKLEGQQRREIENVILQIKENNSLDWVDKQKGLEWLHSVKSNSQANTIQDLKSNKRNLQPILAQQRMTLADVGKIGLDSIIDSQRTTNTVESERIGLDLESVANIVKDFEKPHLSDENILERDGNGSSTDAEISEANDLWVKVWGESFRTKRQKRMFAERERRRMRERAESLSAQLGVEIEIAEDSSRLRGRRQKAKGWYDTRTGRITVVLGNLAGLAEETFSFFAGAILR